MNESPHDPVNPPQPPTTPPVQPPSPQPVVPAPGPAPVAPVAPGIPPQPGVAPPQQPGQHQTDVFGIIGIILAFVGPFQLVGLALGLIGASKAKREGRSPVLSRIAWILNLVFTILISIGILLYLIFAVAVFSQKQAGLTTHGTTSSTSAPVAGIGERQEVIDGYSLIVPDTFVDAPEEYRPESASFMQGDTVTQEYVAIIKDSRHTSPGSQYTLRSYADTVNEANYRNYSELSAVTVTPYSGIQNPVNYDVLDYEVHGVLDGTNVIYYVRYVATNDYFYQIVTWTDASSQVTATPDLEKIIASFREE